MAMVHGSCSNIEKDTSYSCFMEISMDIIGSINHGNYPWKFNEI